MDEDLSKVDLEMVEMQAAAATERLNILIERVRLLTERAQMLREHLEAKERNDG